MGTLDGYVTRQGEPLTVGLCWLFVRGLAHAAQPTDFLRADPLI